MTEKKYKYSEIFGGFGYVDEHNKFHPGTVQGEGEYTGIPSVWVRLWGCNKECNGFGQIDPTDETTYELDYLDIDAHAVKTVEELPVCKKGCDSSFSWSTKFAHLATQATAKEIADDIRKRLVNGKFEHPVTNQECHLVFTGGEPILNQNALVAILQELEAQDEFPNFVTIETNGSLMLRPATYEYLDKMFGRYSERELFWSVSPKIYATSGEKYETSIKPEVIKQYQDISSRGQLKFVSNGSARSWKEIDEAIQAYRDAEVDYPIWIMPVGSTVEGQKLLDADVADQAIYRGYNVSARVHVYLYGNTNGR